MNDYYNEFDRAFNVELDAIKNFGKQYAEQIDEITDIIGKLVNCEGLVIVSGMGKSGHIANKISATMASLGVKSIYLHPAEALHGDLGRVDSKDLVILFSNSGNTQEMCKMLVQLNKMHIDTVAVTANVNSYMYKNCANKILLPNVREACHMGLAPSSSTTLQLMIGDALAISASKAKGYTKKNFARNHPSGALGNKLSIYIKDIMHAGDENPIVYIGSELKDALIDLSEFGMGAISIVDHSMNLMGLITDGDLKRILNKKIDVYSCKVEQVMTKNPIVIAPDELAFKALKAMEARKKQISVLPVVKDNKVRIHDLFSLAI